jgi:very-short-patch-repair endonuclease
LSAPQNIESSPRWDGSRQAFSKSVIPCAQCERPIRNRSETGLCWLCYRRLYRPNRARWAVKSVCACGKPKTGRATRCQACARVAMGERNRRDRDMLTMARETGRAALRRSSLEVKAEALFRALGISFETNRKVGRFVADFYLPAYHAIVEVYGGMHRQEPALTRDRERAAVIAAAGYRFVVLSDLDMHLWWRLLRDGLPMSGT